MLLQLYYCYLPIIPNTSLSTVRCSSKQLNTIPQLNSGQYHLIYLTRKSVYPAPYGATVQTGMHDPNTYISHLQHNYRPKIKTEVNEIAFEATVFLANLISFELQPM